jgi:hypothetical protein
VPGDHRQQRPAFHDQDPAVTAEDKGDAYLSCRERWTTGLQSIMTTYGLGPTQFSARFGCRLHGSSRYPDARWLCEEDGPCHRDAGHATGCPYRAGLWNFAWLPAGTLALACTCRHRRSPPSLEESLSIQHAAAPVQQAHRRDEQAGGTRHSSITDRRRWLDRTVRRWPGAAALNA